MVCGEEYVIKWQFPSTSVQSVFFNSFCFRRGVGGVWLHLETEVSYRSQHIKHGNQLHNHRGTALLATPTSLILSQKIQLSSGEFMLSSSEEYRLQCFPVFSQLPHFYTEEAKLHGKTLLQWILLLCSFRGMPMLMIDKRVRSSGIPAPHKQISYKNRYLPEHTCMCHQFPCDPTLHSTCKSMYYIYVIKLSLQQPVREN